MIDFPLIVDSWYRADLLPYLFLRSPERQKSLVEATNTIPFTVNFVRIENRERILGREVSNVDCYTK